MIFYHRIFSLTFSLLVSLPLFAKELALTDEELAYIAQHPTIEVGVSFDYIPFSFEDRGQPRGMAVDIIDYMSSLTGINFVVRSSRWPEVYNAFSKGELKMLANVSYSDERAKFSLFTDPYYEIPIAVFVNDNVSQYQDLYSLVGKRVGVTQDLFYLEALQAIEGIEVVQYEKSEQQFQDLQNGTIDAILENEALVLQFIQTHSYTNFRSAGYASVGDYNREDLRFGIHRSEPILLTIISKALNAVMAEHRLALIDKWFNVASRNIKKIAHDLTAEEETFIKENREVRYCATPNSMPIEGFSKEARHEGIIADYLKIIAAYSHLTFQTVATKSQEEARTFMQLGQCDIVANFSQLNDSKQFLRSEVFSHHPVVVVTKSSELFIQNLGDFRERNIGVIVGHGYDSILREEFPGINLISVANDGEGLQQVRNGELFAYVGVLPIIAYYLQNEKYTDIKISGKLNTDLNLTFSIRKDNPLLQSIVNKSIATVPTREVEQIANKWFSVTYEDGIDYTLFWQIISISSLIVVIVLYWNQRLRKTMLELRRLQQQLEITATTDQLTGLINRRQFETILDYEISRADRQHSQFGLILIDIDFFKNINDTHGHSVGDQVLVGVAKILSSRARKTDHVARWGGEEFAIICPDIDLPNSIAFAESLRQILAEQIFPEVNHLTASFGVTAYEPGDSSHTIFINADKALYKAKEQGRNKVCS